MGNRVGIALGSNLGNRLANIREARDTLRDLVDSESLYLQAPIFQTEPVDCNDDVPDFYNTVVEIDYIGEPHELLSRTQEIERRLGRERVYERNAPRVIDVDILYFGEVTLNDENLIIPHPRLAYRRFVLEPLSEIRPELILPKDQVTIEQHLQHLDSEEGPLTLVQSVW